MFFKIIRLLLLIVVIISCSPKLIYTQNSIRLNGGIERKKQIGRITKHNQRLMNKVRKKVTNEKSKSLRKRKKYS
jgi:hypothetical protein